MKYILICIVVLGFVACGPGQPEPKVAAQSDVEQVDLKEESSTSSSETETNWTAMNFEEKQAYMKETVEPSMGELFKPAHPDFSCVSCHGANFSEVNFKMPNTLDPLDPQNMPFESTDEKIKGAAQFMKEKVVPKMAGLLGMEPYNPETQTGLGCFNCHATKI